MATIRHVVRRALRHSTLGRSDRTYARPHRRQSCYGEFIMPSFSQPRPTAGFSDRHLGLDGRHAAGTSPHGAGQLDAPTWVRRGCRRRLLRRGRPFREEGIHRHSSRTLWWRWLRPAASDCAPSSNERSRRSTCSSSSATAARRGRKRGRRFPSSRSGWATARRRRGESGFE